MFEGQNRVVPQRSRMLVSKRSHRRRREAEAKIRSAKPLTGGAGRHTIRAHILKREDSIHSDAVSDATIYPLN